MHALRHAVHGAYKTTMEAVTPIRSSSAFASEGVLTPEEFVAAGDALTRACPTWTWTTGQGARARSYLPREKQYLTTRRVPCARRARDVEAYAGAEEALTGEDEGWIATGAGGRSDGATMETIPDLGAMTLEADAEDDAEDEYEDEDDDAVVLPTATAIAKEAAGANGERDDENIVKTRTYDVSITYDKYYQTPRVWLNGYDENRLVLKPSKTLEDISADHAQKTVTIDPHPHTGVPSASIHPCKHASVMKKLVNSARAQSGEAPSVDSYMFVFLKFIASVVPTIEYDYTL
jgi:ubiquitin-like-conjugating enzyme ATG3